MSQSSPQPSPKSAESKAARLDRLRKLSHLLDNAIAIPGTNYRVGLDPLLGMLPIAGDYLGSAFSAYIVLESALMGLPRQSLLRMVLNIIFETVAGSVPIVGDIFDVTWKANARNMAMLETHIASPQASEKADWWFLAMLFGGLMLVVTLMTAIGVIILTLLWRLISGG